jgi:hypothetical protein
LAHKQVKNAGNGNFLSVQVEIFHGNITIQNFFLRIGLEIAVLVILTAEIREANAHECHPADPSKVFLGRIVFPVLESVGTIFHFPSSPQRKPIEPVGTVTCPVFHQYKRSSIRG